MHDKHGNALRVGDIVTVECRVKTTYATSEFCNVTLETVEPMFPGDTKTTLTLNTKQVSRDMSAPREAVEPSNAE